MNCPFYTALSPIHGRGLFANEYFPVGSALFKVADKKGNVTKLGKLINHSIQANIILHAEPDGYYAIASMPIYQGREIIGNYNWTPACLEKPDPQWS